MHATHCSAWLLMLSVINSLVKSQAGSIGVHPYLIQLIRDQPSATASRGSIIQRDFPWAQLHVALPSYSMSKIYDINKM